MGKLLWIDPETDPIPGRCSPVEVICNAQKECWVPCQMREAVLYRQSMSAQGFLWDNHDHGCHAEGNQHGVTTGGALAASKAGTALTWS